MAPVVRPAVLHGDMKVVLRDFPDNHFHSIVTDPPYNLESITKRFGKAGAAPAQFGTDGAFARASRGFMGKAWDSDVAFDPATWAELMRVLRPGGYVAAFGGTRTFHRMAIAMEDAGFDIRDTLMWVYGTGMPKSHSIRKEHPEWAGYGSNLKPAYEPILLGQKPRERGDTIADTAMTYGTGLLNIEACRVDTVESLNGGAYSEGGRNGLVGDEREGAAAGMFAEGGGRLPGKYTQPEGRWPANLVHDGSDEARAAFPDSKGQQGIVKGTEAPSGIHGTYSRRERVPSGPVRQEADTSAARFFPTCPYEDEDAEMSRMLYSSKASKADRQGTAHPTTKPIKLMRWLAKLITPTGGHVLDPFAGSGSTGTACIREGFPCTLIDLEAEHIEMINTRISLELGENNDILAELDAIMRVSELEELESLLSCP